VISQKKEALLPLRDFSSSSGVSHSYSLCGKLLVFHYFTARYCCVSILLHSCSSVTHQSLCIIDCTILLSTSLLLGRFV